ncbi:MAG: YfhO family protein [Oscillospiraceae bacterium]|jgi:uncharacterized membrane protein YfhO|nr:YfhO family protein [Oscillospiraceae bacterium]MCI1991492.1 YfhO family protein [Oscillospiraceae bacterium]MCI2036230.1 YfhO family protein [Oscillospiraceae bacterium]
MAKKHGYWAAPGIVLAVLLSVYASYGLFPFGTGTVSWCDMNQQVIPFLMDWKNILSGRADLFLNLQNAGGMSFWGVFLFFVSSPFSFLVVFVQKPQDFYYFVNLLLMLKMMTCSVTAVYYFNRRFPDLTCLQAVSLSVMYAFCGYAMFYYQNIVWLDVMYLFPLLLDGLARLAGENRVLPYTVAFAAILTVNFYLTYMVVIFLILGCGVYLLACVPPPERRGVTLRFGLSTLAAGLMTGVVWLPSLLQYLKSARTGNLVSSLRSGGILSRLDTTLPVVLCTGAIGAAVVMALVLRKYRESRVRWILWMLFLVLVPVFLEPVNKMWQTGSYQSFPVRYGYIPAFLGLILFAACVSAVNRDRFPSRSGFSALPASEAFLAVAAVAFCAGMIVKFNFETVTAYTKTLWGNSESFRQLLLLSVAASFAYLILLLLYHYRGIGRAVFSIFLCVLAVVEAAFYSSVYVASAKSNAQYYSPVLDLSGKISDSGFYRVKMDRKYFEVNLVGSMGYNSLSHYTSLTSKDYMFGMKKLGYSSYWMEVNSNGGTKLTDAILGNRYVITKTDGLSAAEKPVYGNGLYSIVKNKISLPIGIVMRSGRIGSLEKLPDTTRLLTQQYLFQSVFSTSQQLFVPYRPASLDNVTETKDGRYRLSLQDPRYEGTVTYKIPVAGTQTLYFDCFDQLTNRLYEPINSSFSITVDGKMLEIQYPSQPDNGLFCLGTFTNRTVTVEIGVLRDVDAESFGVAGLKDDVLRDAVDRVGRASLKQTGNSVTGTAFSGTDDAYLFLPISYDSGYTAAVNGKPAKISRVFDTFMAVPLEKGENRISVSYVPAGFRPGLAISILGLAGLLLLHFAVKKRAVRKLDGLGAPVSVLFTALFVLTLAAVYLFPLILILL